MDLFLLNAIVYVLTFLYFLHKFKEFNLYVVIWALYAFIAIMGYFCVTENYHYSGDVRLGYKVAYVPYICIYLTFLTLISPFYKLEISSFNFSFLDTPFFRNLVKLSIIPFFFVLCVKIYTLYVVSKMGFGECYELGHTEGEALIEYSNPLLSSIIGWTRTYYIVFQPVFILYFINLLIHKDRSNFMNIIFLILGFLPSVIDALAHGSKGGLFFAAADLIFYYICFKSFLSSYAKKTIVFLGGIFIAVLCFFSFLITDSRNDVSNSTRDNYGTIICYLGETIPNVGWDLYPHTKTHLYGKRFYPEFYNGEKSEFKSQAEGFEYWSAKTGASVAIFKTFWGDCYIEFGLWGSIVYILFFVFLWRKFVFRHSSDPVFFPLIFYYYHFFITYGLFCHSFNGIRQHIMFLYLVILCIIMHRTRISYK